MEKFSQFGVEPILLLAQIINFLLLLYLLKRFLYKPILTMLKKREEKIHEGLAAGAKGEEMLAKAQGEEKKILVRASTEANSVLEQTREKAGKLEEELRLKAKEESERILSDGRAQLEIEREAIGKELEKKTIGTAIDALERILPKTLTKEDHVRILSASERMLQKVLPI